MTILNRVCPTCNKTFQIELARFNAGRGKHCSRQCAYKDRPSPEERFWANVIRPSNPEQCWGWKGSTDKRGYPHFSIHNKTKKATRFAYELLVAPIPKGQYVCHKCDNPPCCNPNHLFAGTHLDNSRDMREKGRSMTGNRNPSRTHPETRPRAEQHHMTTLTWKQVREIRALFADGKHSMRGLGRAFGVTNITIRNIVYHRTWKEQVEH